MRKTIKVVMIEPGMFARTAEIFADLESMQEVVGGFIEAFYPFEEDVCIICSDEGKLLGMPLNRAVRSGDGDIIDVIAGPAFICDCSGENFASLNEEQIERYTEMFRFPQLFFMENGKVNVMDMLPWELDVY